MACNTIVEGLYIIAQADHKETQIIHGNFLRRSCTPACIQHLLTINRLPKILTKIFSKLVIMP
jgi:hypothetical protein